MIAVILVGVPCAGKSTFRSKFLEMNPDYVVCSSDDHIDKLCEQEGITYSDGFTQFIKQAEDNFQLQLNQALIEDRNLIIDRTNCSVNGRAKYIEKLRKAGYKVYAYYFEVPMNQLLIRLKKRGQETGKNIPFSVIQSMLKNYERPTDQEFDEVHDGTTF